MKSRCDTRVSVEAVQRVIVLASLGSVSCVDVMADWCAHATWATWGDSRAPAYYSGGRTQVHVPWRPAPTPEEKGW